MTRWPFFFTAYPLYYTKSGDSTLPECKISSEVPDACRFATTGPGRDRFLAASVLKFWPDQFFSQYLEPKSSVGNRARSRERQRTWSESLPAVPA